MTARLLVDAIYTADPDATFRGAMDFRELKTAMRSIAVYDGLPDGIVEQGATYRLRTRFWGWLDAGEHVIQVEAVDFQRRVIQSRESNSAVARWDHRLTVEPYEAGAVWRDEVVVGAGWRTPGVVRFARYVYQARHKARGALSIRSGIEAVGE